MDRALLAMVVGFFGLLGGWHVPAEAVPIADFSFSPQDADVNTEVVLDASASQSSQGRIVRYEWDFNGDGQFEESLENSSLVHLFDDVGSVAVTLRVTEQGGGQATVAKVISVRSAAVTVRRVISGPLAPNRVPAGSAVQVTVTIKVNQSVNGLGLDESVPEGWRVGSSESNGAFFKASQGHAQWLWFQLNAGETLRVVYTMTVPGGTSGGLFRIEGIVSSFSPRFEISVPGDREIKVI